MLRRAHAVLIRISPGYPPLEGRFLRITHPSATRHPCVLLHTVLPFDLHVLGMPPAFNLSQDQTLQFKDFDFRPRAICPALSVQCFKLRIEPCSEPSSSAGSSAGRIWPSGHGRSLHGITMTRAPTQVTCIFLMSLRLCRFASFAFAKTAGCFSASRIPRIRPGAVRSPKNFRRISRRTLHNQHCGRTLSDRRSGRFMRIATPCWAGRLLYVDRKCSVNGRAAHHAGIAAARGVARR